MKYELPGLLRVGQFNNSIETCGGALRGDIPYLVSLKQRYGRGKAENPVR